MAAKGSIPRSELWLTLCGWASQLARKRIGVATRIRDQAPRRSPLVQVVGGPVRRLAGSSAEGANRSPRGLPIGGQGTDFIELCNVTTRNPFDWSTQVG